MNKVILIGRLTKDPNVSYSQSNGESRAIARYTLAVDRGFSRNNANGDQPTADFISCVAFGKSGEFVEKYLRKGTKIAVTGRIQTGSYTNKEGQKVYTTDVVVENHEFVESKNAAPADNTGFAPADRAEPQADPGDGFMNIPDGIEEELPFG